MADLHLYIYDEVTEGLEKTIQNELKQMPDAENIYVHISSPGGGVYTGWTVGNILANQKKKTIALIEGFCASIATYIALSCDEVQMADTAQFMIHNASLGFAEGNKNDLNQYAKQLDKIDQDLISKYVKKTGLSRDQISKMMDEETFLNSEETIKMGFADGLMKPLKAVAKFDFNMDNKEEVTGLFKNIQNTLKKILNNTEPKAETEPSNMTLELEDGKMIFVRSEDGEMEGKPVVMADEEGNPTEEPAPDGTHRLRDGRSITVEGGVVVSVQEEDEEDEEMAAKLKEYEDKIKDLETQLAAKAEAEAKSEEAQNEMKEQFKNLASQVEQLQKVTVGTPFKADKPVTQPQNKSVDTNQSSDDFNGMGRLHKRIMQNLK